MESGTTDSGPAGGAPRRRMSKWLLTAILVAPVLVVAALLYLIQGSINSGTKLAGPPVGAGAGHTGMANEYMHRDAPEDPNTPASEPAADPNEPASAGGAPDDPNTPVSVAAGEDGTENASPGEPTGDQTGEQIVEQSAEQPAAQPSTTPTTVSADLVRPETLPQGFVLVVDDVTRQASDAEPIYLASSWNGWDPMDPARQLERRSDGKWQIVLTPPEADAASIAFKFTMGGWDREELNSDGDAIANRLLEPVDRSRLAAGERPVIELAVIRFRTPAEARAPRSEIERPIEATGTVVRLELVGGAGRAAGTVRNAQVWLPPGYSDPANAQRRYPVLYMLDGQNLFQTPPGGFGEWHADETATRLIEEGRIEPLIIVGIPHAGLYRSDEYLPFSWIPNADASGAAFEAWLLGHVMPRVERAFRVQTGAEHTGIGGASLGGVMSVFIGTRHPDVFGRMLAESVSTMGGPTGEFSMFVNGREEWPRRVFIGMGGREAREIASTDNDAYVEWARSLERRALATSRPPEVKIVVVPEHAHNEDAWAARLPEALEFLFPAR
ncbi:MAG: hypothetical protein KDA05_01365 [Phycisphaerales bacterium]|nr:hypothetical protein [Phycisphaerales bacterium]